MATTTRCRPGICALLPCADSRDELDSVFGPVSAGAMLEDHHGIAMMVDVQAGDHQHWRPRPDVKPARISLVGGPGREGAFRPDYGRAVVGEDGAQAGGPVPVRGREACGHDR